ncbi:MAG: gliding motility-associated C-terminal domain-containing protein, partial [Bacteroidota bacterium]
LQATVDETASGGSATETTGYTFDWYQGNITLTTLPATPYASGSTMTGAPDGNYSVVVTRTATGCQSIVYRALPRQIIRPVIDLNATLVHADNCTDPWGSSITVSADGGQTSADSYTFEWRDAGGTVIAGETTETLSNIPPGVYTVLVTSPLGCTAQNTAQYEILDQAPKPVVTLQRFNNSSCDPGQPNGVVAATGFTKPVDAYIWEWFETSPSGAPVAAANYSANGDTIFNLSANTYALQITDTLTRCSSVRFINLSDNPATPPALDTLSVTATTDCRAISADGEVIFEVVGGAQPLPYNASTNRTYTFRLYTGTAATGAPLATNATGVFSGLNFNDYTATVEDDFTRCVSPPMTISIEQDPDITITRDHQVSPISCAVADGEIGVEVTSPSNTAPSGAGYSFTWYSLGNSKNGPATINPGADLPTLDNFSSRRQGLTTGYYVVEVSDNFTSCTVYDTLFLPQANPPIINASTTPSDQCSPGTGDIDLTLDPNGFSLDRYHVYLYIGNSLDLGNEIDTLNPSGMAIVSLSFPDYAPQQYTIGIIDTISGCPINSETVRIDLNNPDPSISFTAAADYTCNADGTGLLDAYVEGGGDNDNVQGNFTFEWFSGTNTSTPLNVATQVDPSDPSIAINLLEGFYTVRVTDNDGPGNGCSYTQTYFLPKQYRTIAISSTNALPDSVCGPTPTGTIWIETVTEDGAAVSLADYTFELLNDSFTLQANAGSGTASDPFVALPEGSYYVRATNQLTDCETVSNLIPIDNTAESPAITIIEEAPDFSCAMGSSTDGTGELNATALGTFDNDTNQDHFTYTWFAGSDTLSANQLLPANIDSSDPSRTIGLTAGLYTVLVQDTSGHSNQCIFFSTHEVTSVEREVILTLDSDPQQLCSPADGTAFVTDTREEYFFNGIQVIDTDPIDYTYVLYDDDLTAPPSVIGTGLNTPTDKFQELAEGTYFITTDSTDNCYSAPTPVAVDNISEDPLVSIALLAAQYSQNPDPTSWTGALQAQVQVHPDQPLDSINDAFTYQYRWYDAANYTLGNELGTNDAIAQLDSGEYLLEVTNLVTNCVNTATFYLPFVEVEPQLLMQANPQTVCFANGSLTLDSITFLGQADPTEDYLIRLYANVYDTTQAATDSVMNFSGTTPFDSLLAGTYYLQAFHQTLYLSSNVLQLDITDESTPPLIEILDLQLQVSCDTARLATGAIAIQAIEADGTYDPYTYRWFRGQTTNPINELVLETTPEIDSLPSGFYTVLVENQRTRCSTLEPIFVPEDITLPDITASTTPASVCDPALANGAVRAEPLSVGNYRYDWYRGDTIRLAPDFTGQVWAGVMPGNYTVTATDIATNTCVSPPITVTVADESTLPIVTVEMENPYTTCDPLRPNGTLYAVSDGPPANFTYLWYDTLNQIVGDLPRAFNLTPQTYRVAVTDITTGCTTEAVGTIVRDEQIVIPPTVDIQSHMTNCAQPDGAATAAVNGDIDGYAFLFYDADGNPLPDSLIQVNESDLQVSVSQLAAGTYQVTATDLATDCVSEITFFDILDEGYTPPFRAETTPASCGDSNGSATIIPSDNLRLLSTVWTTPEANVVVSEGNVTKNLPAGTLAVEMRWENGCSYFGTIEIGTDICVYNTVTPNGDGDHDFLEIGAIEQFPDNSVKIFNRAGALVYESERYNNQNTRFEGTGNRGLYLGGQQLPDGTYFFVIDKKNGSQPKTGYLELIR